LGGCVVEIKLVKGQPLDQGACARGRVTRGACTQRSDARSWGLRAVWWRWCERVRGGRWGRGGGGGTPRFRLKTRDVLRNELLVHGPVPAQHACEESRDIRVEHGCEREREKRAGTAEEGGGK